MLARAILATATAILLAVPSLRAQSRWLVPDAGRTLWLEMLHPDLEEAGAATSAWRVGARIPFGERLALVAEVPFGHADLDLDPSDETGTTGLGNPYVGIERAAADGCTRAEVGARVPLAPDDNAGVAVGFLGDFIDHAESFVPDVVPVTLGVSRGCPVGATGWTVRVRGAGSIWIPVGDGGDTEVMALYGLQGWYERAVLFGVGVTGRGILTEEGDLGERTVHQVGAVLGYDFGPARPAVEVRVPLDEEIRDEIPYTVGIGVVFRR